MTDPLPRGVRNNNPGNLRKSPIPWKGEIAGADPTFETFDTPQSGIRALAIDLINAQRLHGLATVRQIMARYAPPNENATLAYIARVAHALGVSADQRVELRDPHVLTAFAVTIIAVECAGHAYPAEVVEAGIEAALAAVPKPA